MVLPHFSFDFTLAVTESLMYVVACLLLMFLHMRALQKAAENAVLRMSL